MNSSELAHKCGVWSRYWPHISTPFFLVGSQYDPVRSVTWRKGSSPIRWHRSWWVACTIQSGRSRDDICSSSLIAGWQPIRFSQVGNVMIKLLSYWLAGPRCEPVRSSQVSPLTIGPPLLLDVRSWWTANKISLTIKLFFYWLTVPARQ